MARAHESGEDPRIPATDTTAQSPLGVGESITPQGNEAALDETEEERRKDREDTGIAPGKPIDPAMPNLRPGDQAG